MKQNLVIYHDNCFDGFMSMLVCHSVFGDTATYLPAQYKRDTVQDIVSNYDLTGLNVYIVDFSFPPDDLRVLSKAVGYEGKVTVLDHHKTTFEHYGFTEDGMKELQVFVLRGADNVHVLLDNNRSGCRIAFDYFQQFGVNPKLEQMVMYIDDHDRWQFKLPNTKAFIAFLGKYNRELESWYELADMLADPEAHADVLTIGNRTLQEREVAVAIIVSKAKPAVIAMHDHVLTGRIVSCGREYMSDVGNTMAKQGDQFGMIVSINQDNPSEVLCSLRSIGNVDVSAVAKRFGGGGHKNAAGFTVSAATYGSWLYNDIFLIKE